MTTSIASTGLPPFADDPPRSCKGTDPHLWFPPAGRPWAQTEAKRICWTCPLRAECLEWAVPITDLFGGWAATTAAERKKIRTGKAAT